MIVSPRAKEVIDVLRIDGEKLIEVDEVFLYHRIGVGAPYRKTRYWKREIDRPEGEGSNEDAVSPSKTADDGQQAAAE